MSDPIISVSGLRGIIGKSLTPDLAIRYVATFASSLHPGKVLVTHDGRATGPMMIDAVSAAIAAAGREPLIAGVASTPTAGILVKHKGCVGGVQISASHNPPEYNGLKLFGDDGRILPAGMGQAVKERYLAGKVGFVDHAHVGTASILEETTAEHLRLIEAIVDVDRIRKSAFRVVLDSNHGSGSLLGRQLLEHLGCAAVVLGDNPNGQFAHPPEPTAVNLASVATQIPAAKADVCFCQDPDADRLAIIDATGRYLGEELTLALCVDHQLRQEAGPIVSNCSSSRVTQDLAEKYNVPFHRSAVGEANVVDTMIAHNAVLGGEGAGGVIHPQVGFVRDSFVGMAMVLDAMAARSTTIAALADELPQYAIHKTKVTLPAEKIADALDAIEARFPEAESNRMDGLRLDWPSEKKWLLVRASNTEPIVRLIAEAPDQAAAEAACAAAAAVLD